MDIEFEELRNLTHKIIKEKHDTILSAWCKEAGVKTPVGYYIYTDKPGYLIGKSGCLVEKYQKLLQMQFSTMKSIKFVEIKGGFSNCVAD